MTNHIQWTYPIDSSWTHAYIDRSTTELGVYVNIGSQLIADSTYFDINGTSTSWYKIRFYDSVTLTFSDYSSPMQGVSETLLTGEAENTILVNSINSVSLMSSMGATGPVSGQYTIFGMAIHQNTVEALVSQAYDYTTELIGEGAIVATDTSTVRKIKGFISSYAAIRILAVLTGTSITTHFNYTSGGLNIQKPAVSQMAAMVVQYTAENNRWRKLLLTRAIVTTTTADLQLSIINEADPIGSGIQRVSYDFPGI